MHAYRGVNVRSSGIVFEYYSRSMLLVVVQIGRSSLPAVAAVVQCRSYNYSVCLGSSRTNMYVIIGGYENFSQHDERTRGFLPLVERILAKPNCC